MDKIWLNHYPKGVPESIVTKGYDSVLDILDHSTSRFRDLCAFSSMNSELTYEDLQFYSADFAAYLQNCAGLQKGDRIAIQLPNVLQYPVALFGALRAGLTVVNTNPLYTPRELRHQLKDSGAKAIVLLANTAHNLEEILADTDIETVIITEVGDLLGWPKSWVVNGLIRYVKKLVPKYNLPAAISWHEALDLGSQQSVQPVNLSGEDLAFLQYTGGTTGVSKGAMLTHANIVANVLQIKSWMQTNLKEGEEIAVLALPLYHIFSLTVNAFAIMAFGGTNIMILNPRDISGFIKILKATRFTVFPALNTLFNALMNHPDFSRVNFSQLKISVAGGMALQKAVALRWRQVTGSPIVEGYGLTETSPVVCCNPINGQDQLGTIGPPLPSTEIRIVDDTGLLEIEQGKPGELWVKGPQVMKGYWQRHDETDKVMKPGGWLATGDIGLVNADGFVQIVDRKKDMILVSGFNVYPNEIEDVLADHPKILEAAVIGVPDAHSGESVKAFVVKKDLSLTKEEVLAHCHKQLTAYKVPKIVEFSAQLPKSPIGKVLRKELRTLEASPERSSV